MLKPITLAALGAEKKRKSAQPSLLKPGNQISFY